VKASAGVRQRGVCLAIAERLLEGIQGEVGAQRRRRPPPDNPAGEHVDHERDVHNAAPWRDVRDVRHPQRIRSIGGERALHEVYWAIGGTSMPPNLVRQL
jgi:hypothetical protein